MFPAFLFPKQSLDEDLLFLIPNFCYNTEILIGLNFLLNDKFDKTKVRIFNQVSEILSVDEIAKIISDQYGSKINYLKNPRKELEKNDLEVSNDGLKSIGFQPITLNNNLIDDIRLLANTTKANFNKENVLNSPLW